MKGFQAMVNCHGERLCDRPLVAEIKPKVDFSALRITPAIRAGGYSPKDTDEPPSTATISRASGRSVTNADISCRRRPKAGQSWRTGMMTAIFFKDAALT